MIERFLKSRWTYATLRVMGFGLLVGYFVLTGNWHFSLYWALAFPAIALFVSWLIVMLNLSNHFPRLNRYFLFPKSGQNTETALSEDEWALGQAKYLENGMQGASILLAPAEDGLICVPILMAGLGLISAVLGGLAFGLLHLGRFTYLECIGKSIYYTLVCIFVLPHGLLTIALGHLLMDLFGLVTIKIAKRRLLRKLRFNPAAKRDTPQAARPLP